MEVLASTSLDVAAVMTAVVAILGAIGALIKWLIDRFDKLSERQEAAFKTAIEKLDAGIQKQVAASQAVAAATEQGNREAAERNGHLGEQNIQITEMVSAGFKQLAEVADRNLEAYSKINKQIVKEQVVQKEVVKSQEKLDA